MTEPVEEQRRGGLAAWMKEQITVGNLAVIIVLVGGMFSFQTRAEMKDVAHDEAIARLEQRLRDGEFMRADVAQREFNAIRELIAGLKDSLDKGFARIERAVR